MKSSVAVAGEDGKASEYNNLRDDWRLGLKALKDVAYGATMDFDLANTDKSNFFLTGSMVGNATVTFSNVVTGQPWTAIFQGDGTARTIIWPANIKWPNNTPPTFTGRIDVINFVRINATDIVGLPGGFNIY